MFSKIIETFFVKKKEYKRNKITVVRCDKKYSVEENIDAKLIINKNGDTTCLSKYFALRKGLNVAERKYYNNVKITARNQR